MYVEIKHPFAHLVKDDNCVVFFEHGFEEDKPIVSWDDIFHSYPRWSLSTHTKKEAIERVTEMVEDEGWELYETTEQALQKFTT